MSILSISLIFHELNYIKESSEETIIRVPYEDRMHVSGLYKNGMARNLHAINQTQECAWANVIRLFLTCHQANQGCLFHTVQEVRGGIQCNDPLYQFQLSESILRHERDQLEKS